MTHWSNWLNWLFSDFLTHVGFLLALVFLANLDRQRRSPSSTLAWLLVILLLPYVGVPLYLLVGGRKMGRLANRKEPIYERPPDRFSDHHMSSAGRLLASYGIPPCRSGNRVELVTSGVVAYQRALRLIDEARSTIHITTYILGRDEGSQVLIDHLRQRASEGVAVRLLIDALGSWRISRRFLRPLRSAGAQVAFFMPVLHLPFRGRANLRNHRKVLVADGRIALTGGMNLAWPYMGPATLGEPWRDLSVVIEGPAVADLEALFQSDWKFATDAEMPPTLPPMPALSPGRMESTNIQVVASGPDVSGDPLYESLLALIFAAEDRIWIITPYFVPDEMLIRALTLAARRGVDVRVIVPARSNHLTADLARAGYLRDLANASAQILFYTPAMLHAKVVIFDDQLAVVGSANMDMRSLFLNYEVALFIGSPGPVADVASWACELIADTIPGQPRPGLARVLCENVVRLLSPLL